MTIPATLQVSARSATEQAYDLIRNEILDGELLPGEVVDVRNVVEASGASRTPVRDALERLAQQGLIERKWRVYVIDPSPEEGRQAVATLGVLARQLSADVADADAVITAVRELDAAGGRAPFEKARGAVLALCERSSNQILAQMARQGLDALLYRAQFAIPATAWAAA